VEIPSPCFVLEEQLLIRNLKLLDRVQKEAGVSIILAFKGFSMWSSFPLVKQYLSGATASSLHEAQLCFEEMGTKSHSYLVAYEPHSFKAIADLSSHLSFNSISQYNRFIADVPQDVSVGLRINPEWSDVEVNLYNPASSDSRLGITEDQFPDELPERVEGLHFHVLCESGADALAQVLENVEAKFGKYLSQIDWINMGGGHLITREGYDIEQLISILTRFRKKHDVEIILEPGSAIAWQTGDLHASVLDIVERGGVKTAIADISFTCHMPDCLEMPYKPVIKGASLQAKSEQFVYRIGGVSCLAGDYMGGYGFDQPLAIGDALVFEDMMHYTMVKTSTFNGVRHPSIGIKRQDGSFELVRSFDYQDFKRRLS
jgi:carboxynorspermidine decarboxylase